MASESAVVKGNRSTIHPHKIALWISFGSILMMFAGLTSAYAVRQAAGNWHEFKLPTLFFLSTGVIVLSSVALHGSLHFFKKGNESVYKILLLLAFLLGCSFIVMQYMGWEALASIGVMINGNPADSFMYVIPGLHAAHVLGGLGALTVAMVHGFSLPFKPTPRRILRLELTTQYWHFVDLLWVYLLLFFVLQQSA